MKRRPTPRFSIVIPCYNEANFIAATLTSLKAQQTTEAYEIIVVDNNCTDDTASIARSFGVTVVEELVPGVCAARQAGTKAARGEIVISTDADTTFSPRWLDTISRSFASDKRLVAVGGPCRFVDGPWWGRIYTHFLFTGSYLYSLVRGYPFYMTATNIAFKKAAWDSYDIYITQGGDELDLLHKLRRRGRVAFNNSNPVFTSGRRLNRGLWYNVFVSFLYFYLCAYYLDRIFKRPIIGAAPSFRGDGIGKAYVQVRAAGLLIAITALTFFFLTAPPIRGFVVDNFSDSVSLLQRLI